jgi:ATP-citrate lyase beta-subunit
MAQAGIREYTAKKMLRKAMAEYSSGKINFTAKSVLVTDEKDLEKQAKKNAWLKKEKLTVKPDQLFGKRGKHGLVGLNLDFRQVKDWIKKKNHKTVKIDKSEGPLTHFLVEPFVEHKNEYYISISTKRERDVILFSNEGGVDIEEHWDNAIEITADLLTGVNRKKLAQKLQKDENQEILMEFISALYQIFVDYNFSFLEINPFTVKNKTIIPLDVVAKLDDTAAFESQDKWGEIEFPVPFGRVFTKEEEYIKNLDEKTGASLKLTILNPKGRVWTMVAGGGASVIYADTISDLGFGGEMANYGEYSGDPSTSETYEYAKTILDLMTREKSVKGKALIIGGGIANFTDVAATFTGIIKAIQEYKDKIKQNKIKIYVRRGGPNYKEGLKKMKELGGKLGIAIDVYGPETHMTEVVSLAAAQLS